MEEYQSDPLSLLHQALDDQDTFLVKIPHRMRDMLKQSNESEDNTRWMDFTGGITLGKRRRENDDIFDGIAGDENDNQDQEFEMHINLHEKEKSLTFDLTLPSLSKIE